MEPVRFFFERGITICNVGSEWHLLNSSDSNPHKVDSPGAAATLYNVRPVAVSFKAPNIADKDALLCKSTELFGHKVSVFYELALKQDFYKARSIIYLLNAVEYHCLQLCQKYSSICQFRAYIGTIPDFLDKNATKSGLAGQAEPYFEFDALVTAVRRTYDSCRYLLWQHFGHSGNVPSSFYRTLPQCSSLPIDVAARLNHSWSVYGEEVTDYRDCIQHYTPIDFGFSQVDLARLEYDVWSVMVPIPDNPSVKARGKFTYAKNRDALTYGWEIANEILEVVNVIVMAIQTKLEVQDNSHQSNTADG